MVFKFGAVEGKQSLFMNPYNLMPFMNQQCYARLSLLQGLINKNKLKVYSAIKILLYSEIKTDHMDSKTCTLVSLWENLSKYLHVSSRHLQEPCCT